MNKRWINPKFIGSFSHADTLPPVVDRAGRTLPEIAMVGRSNAGKSSLINSLLNWRNMARTSKQPGKTIMINLFQIDEWLSVADLPGYGYAKVGLQEKKLWEKELPRYLSKRPQLSTVIIVMDIRRSLEDEEYVLFNSLVHSDHVHTCIFVATKADKLSSHELEKAHTAFENSITHLANQVSRSDFQVIPHVISSTKGTGIQELKKIVESHAVYR